MSYLKRSLPMSGSSHRSFKETTYEDEQDFDDESQDESNQNQIESQSNLTENDLYEDEDEDEMQDKLLNGDDNLKQELSEMPFEELLELKEKLGSKIYNETILGAISGEKNSRNRGNNHEKQFKRKNKNRPREMSSKRRPETVREVIHVKKVTQDSEKRDPRFDERCGKFNERIFKSTYSFVEEIKDKEYEELKKEMKKTKDVERKEEIKYLLQRMENQKRAQQHKDEKIELKRRLTRVEVNDDEGDEGEKKEKEKKKKKERPHFINDSTLKKVELVEKYRTLKKSGKLEKYLEKKRKKNTSRDRKKLDMM